MDQNYKKWLVTNADGKTQVVETYTKSAEDCNADGSLAKLLNPKVVVDLPKSKQKPEKRVKND
jgi:hypothetical protein